MVLHPSGEVWSCASLALAIQARVQEHGVHVCPDTALVNGEFSVPTHMVTGIGMLYTLSFPVTAYSNEMRQAALGQVDACITQEQAVHPSVPLRCSVYVGEEFHGGINVARIAIRICSS